MADTRAHVFVSGRVQGVNFRWRTTCQARQLGVSGWVRNLPDGRVEAVFEGSSDNVRSMIEFVSDGPRLAAVDDVHVDWEDPQGLDGFDVRH